MRFRVSQKFCFSNLRFGISQKICKLLKENLKQAKNDVKIIRTRNAYANAHASLSIKSKSIVCKHGAQHHQRANCDH